MTRRNPISGVGSDANLIRFIFAGDVDIRFNGPRQETLLWTGSGWVSNDAGLPSAHLYADGSCKERARIRDALNRLSKWDKVDCVVLACFNIGNRVFKERWDLWLIPNSFFNLVTENVYHLSIENAIVEMEHLAAVFSIHQS